MGVSVQPYFWLAFCVLEEICLFGNKWAVRGVEYEKESESQISTKVPHFGSHSLTSHIASTAGTATAAFLRKCHIGCWQHLKTLQKFIIKRNHQILIPLHYHHLLSLINSFD